MTEVSEIPQGKKEIRDPVSILFGADSEAKKRQTGHNEDRFFTNRNGFGVFDGVSLPENGDKAAEVAKQTIERQVSRFLLGISEANARRLLTESFRDAHKAIIENLGTGPATTATVVVLVERGRKALIAHVGDSRAYLERKGRLFQFTKDDDILSELVRNGHISREKEKEIRRAMDEINSSQDISEFNERYSYNFDLIRNRITACLGGHEEATPRFSVVELQSGDRLLACSDGVHENLKARQINEMLIKSKTPQEAAQRLKNSASAESVSGSGRAKPDDITAVVAEVNFETVPKPLSIKEATSWSELGRALEAVGGLKSSIGYRDAEYWKKIVGDVRFGRLPRDRLTRASGLRQAFDRIERKEKELVPA